MSQSTGTIQWMFKEKKMSKINVLLTARTDKTASVRDEMGTVYNFTKIKNQWLLNGHHNNKGLLHGTTFEQNI
jgi:hypothetical protein